MDHSRAFKMTRILAVLLIMAVIASALPFTAALASEDTEASVETAALEPAADEEPAEPTEADTDEETAPADEDAPAASEETGTEEPAPEENAEEEPASEPAEEPAGDAEAEEPEEEEKDLVPGYAADERFGTNEDGTRYYINPKTGKLHTGWLQLDGLWYYFWSDGTLATGWCYCNDGAWYYFEKDTGIVHRGWATCQGYTYYMRPENARKQTGWRQIDGYWYYFGKDGKMQTGWVKASDGYWYYFNRETGIVHRGWITTSGGDTYYMRPENAREQTGWRKIDGYWYYFAADGKMVTGWQLLGGYKYYFYKPNDPAGGPVGANAADVTVDGYYVNSSGYTTASWTVWERMVRLAEYQSSSTDYLILVDLTYCRVGVFHGSKGNWEGWYYWSCSPGAYSTPTVRGNFTINSKGQYFYGANTGCRCWYWSEFHGGDYAFHSVLYNPAGNYITDGRLGVHISHGCVRLDINSAYWIYSNCPLGTKVIVY